MAEEAPARRIPAFRLFALCWGVYFCSYLGRLNFSSVMGPLMDQGLLTKPQAGWINTAFFISYAAGQLLSGLLGDRCAPKRLIFIGLLGGGLANLLSGLTADFLPLMVLRTLNGLSMALLWPPMLRTFAVLMGEEDRVRASIHMSSATAAGTLASYLLSALLLRAGSWRAPFWAPGLLLAIASGAWLFGFKRLTGGSWPAPSPVRTGVARGGETLEFWQLMALPGILALVIPAVMHGALKDGVTAWVPAYVGEVFHVAPALSALVTTLLPVVNLGGAVAAQLVYTRLVHSEMRASALFFAVALLALSALAAWGARSLALTLALLSLVTLCMLAINTLLLSVLPLRFERYGRASTLSGALNALAYFGSAAASAAIGLVSARWGWGATVASWVGITLLALLCCLLGAGRRLDP